MWLRLGLPGIRIAVFHFPVTLWSFESVFKKFILHPCLCAPMVSENPVGWNLKNMKFTGMEDIFENFRGIPGDFSEVTFLMQKYYWVKSKILVRFVWIFRYLQWGQFQFHSSRIFWKTFHWVGQWGWIQLRHRDEVG